jgi:hypothetical protein
LIVSGHRFQYFAVGHSNTFHTVGEIPAVERTEFPILTLCLSQAQSECVVTASCTDFWLRSAPAASG